MVASLVRGPAGARALQRKGWGFLFSLHTPHTAVPKTFRNKPIKLNRLHEEALWGFMTPVATRDLCLTLNLNQLGSYFQTICHRRRQQKGMVLNTNLQSQIQSVSKANVLKHSAHHGKIHSGDSYISKVPLCTYTLHTMLTKGHTNGKGSSIEFR